MPGGAGLFETSSFPGQDFQAIIAKAPRAFNAAGHIIGAANKKPPRPWHRAV
jgi:hypothetical protein